MASATKPPSDMRGLHEMLRGGLDWIDVLLIVGTVAVLYLLVIRFAPILGTSHLAAAAAFTPVVGRRMLFGAPDRGVMRTGVLWSLLGIVGMLALLLGAGAACIGFWGLRAPDAPRSVGWSLVGGGLAGVAVGALLDRVRFRREQKSTP